MAEENIILSAQGIKKAYPLPGGEQFYALKEDLPYLDVLLKIPLTLLEYDLK